MQELIIVTKEHLADVIREVVSQCLHEQHSACNEACEDVYYDRDQLCALLHITYPTLWRLEKKGKIEKIKNGSKNLYDKKGVDELIRSGRLNKYSR